MTEKTNDNNIIVIGIAGGSASGKTTVVKKIMRSFKNRNVGWIDLDSYYKDFSGLMPEERKKINFDHPQSIDFELLKNHLTDLKSGKSIQKPVYDFATHLRQKRTEKVYPTKILIMEGILILVKKEIRELLDMKIFCDTPSDIRILRRLERDIKERGRTFESVREQYLKTVRPMHQEFIETTKQFADIIIPSSGRNQPAIDMIIGGINDLLLS
ncbi:MAG: uridine kinase [Victivallales bacterium]|nr:uridine kinase [Victivallales bacterium]